MSGRTRELDSAEVLRATDVDDVINNSGGDVQREVLRKGAQ
jgi:hypothetical protein